MNVILFEDSHWRNLAPISLTRHLALQSFGGVSILDHVRRELGGDGSGVDLGLWGRAALRDVTVEATAGLPYNVEPEEDTVLLINASINPLTDWRSRLMKGEPFVTFSNGRIALARIGRKDLEGITRPEVPSSSLMNSLVQTADRTDDVSTLLFEFPWQMVALNGEAIKRIAGATAHAPTGEGTSARRAATARGAIRGGWTRVGPAAGLRLAKSATVEEMVLFDTRQGPIVVEDEAKIEAFSRITGPCYIGRRCTIHSALLREGTSLGEECRVGGEVEQSIVYPYTNKSHLGFLGHSVVGSWVNLGAGSITSDLKNTYGPVKSSAQWVEGSDEGVVDTGMMKVGAFIGDMAKVSIGTLIFAGKHIGVAAQVMGTVGVDVPSFAFFDGSSGGPRKERIELRLERVMKVQERMMARRGKVVSEGRRDLASRIFDTTKGERKAFGAKKGELGER